MNENAETDGWGVPLKNFIVSNREEFHRWGSSLRDILAAEKGIAVLDFASRIIQYHLGIAGYDELSGDMVFLKMPSGTVVHKSEKMIERVYQIYSHEGGVRMMQIYLHHPSETARVKYPAPWSELAKEMLGYAPLLYEGKNNDIAALSKNRNHLCEDKSKYILGNTINVSQIFHNRGKRNEISRNLERIYKTPTRRLGEEIHLLDQSVMYLENRNHMVSAPVFGFHSHSVHSEPVSPISGTVLNQIATGYTAVFADTQRWFSQARPTIFSLSREKFILAHIDRIKFPKPQKEKENEISRDLERIHKTPTRRLGEEMHLLDQSAMYLENRNHIVSASVLKLFSNPVHSEPVSNISETVVNQIATGYTTTFADTQRWFRQAHPSFLSLSSPKSILVHIDRITFPKPKKEKGNEISRDLERIYNSPTRRLGKEIYFLDQSAMYLENRNHMVSVPVFGLHSHSVHFEPVSNIFGTVVNRIATGYTTVFADTQRWFSQAFLSFHSLSRKEFILPHIDRTTIPKPQKEKGNEISRDLEKIHKTHTRRLEEKIHLLDQSAMYLENRNHMVSAPVFGLHSHSVHFEPVSNIFGTVVNRIATGYTTTFADTQRWFSQTHPSFLSLSSPKSILVHIDRITFPKPKKEKGNEISRDLERIYNSPTRRLGKEIYLLDQSAMYLQNKNYIVPTSVLKLFTRPVHSEPMSPIPGTVVNQIATRYTTTFADTQRWFSQTYPTIFSLPRKKYILVHTDRNTFLRSQKEKGNEISRDLERIHKTPTRRLGEEIHLSDQSAMYLRNRHYIASVPVLRLFSRSVHTKQVRPIPGTVVNRIATGYTTILADTQGWFSHTYSTILSLPRKEYILAYIDRNTFLKSQKEKRSEISRDLERIYKTYTRQIEEICISDQSAIYIRNKNHMVSVPVLKRFSHPTIHSLSREEFILAHADHTIFSKPQKEKGSEISRNLFDTVPYAHTSGFSVLKNYQIPPFNFTDHNILNQPALTAYIHTSKKERVFARKNIFNSHMFSRITKSIQDSLVNQANIRTEEKEEKRVVREMVDKLESKIHQQEERIRNLTEMLQEYQKWGEQERDELPEEEEYFSIFENDFTLEQKRYGII